MMRLKRYFLCVALGVGLLTSPALANSEAQYAASLNSFSYHPIPDGAKVEVEVLNDTDFNLGVGAALVEEFARRGMAAEGKGRFVLSFDTAERFVTSEKESLGEVVVDTELEREDLRLKMWSSNRDSILKRNPPPGAKGRFLFVAVLYDRTEKRRVWEAEASAPANVTHDLAQARKLVPLLAEHLGETIRNKVFDLQ